MQQVWGGQHSGSTRKKEDRSTKAEERRTGDRSKRLRASEKKAIRAMFWSRGLHLGGQQNSDAFRSLPEPSEGFLAC